MKQNQKNQQADQQGNAQREGREKKNPESKNPATPIRDEDEKTKTNQPVAEERPDRLKEVEEPDENYETHAGSEEEPDNTQRAGQRATVFNREKKNTPGQQNYRTQPGDEGELHADRNEDKNKRQS